MVGLVEFDGYYAGDITSYETQTGVPAVPLQTILLDGFDGRPTPGANSGNSEVALDIEMAISMAPGLSKVVVFEAGPNGMGSDVLEAMATNTLIKQFGCSWSFGSLNSAEQSTMDNYFLRLGAQGQRSSMLPATAAPPPMALPLRRRMTTRISRWLGEPRSPPLVRAHPGCRRRSGMPGRAGWIYERRRRQHHLRHSFLAKGR